MSGPRLLIVTQDYPPSVGGIQTWARDLSRALHPKCESLAVVAPRHKDSKSFDQGEPFPIFRVPCTSDTMRAVALPWIIRAAKNTEATVALTGHWYVGASCIAARRLGVLKHVMIAAHAQELLKAEGPPPVSSMITRHRRWTLRQADALLPVSSFTAGLLANDGVRESAIHVCPNGTHLEEFSRDEHVKSGSKLRASWGLASVPVIGTLSRLVPRKGIDTVIAAMPAILDKFPDLHYVVAGTGPDLDRLQKLCHRAGVAHRVRFVGRLQQNTVAAFHHAIDAFVMPARQEGPSVEGFGLVFREANACGRPVIAGQSGGVPDAVRDGETGLLIPPDEPKHVEAAVLHLISNPDRARALGVAGRELIVEEGTWRHTADRVLSAWKTLR